MIVLELTDETLFIDPDQIAAVYISKKMAAIPRIEKYPLKIVMKGNNENTIELIIPKEDLKTATEFAKRVSLLNRPKTI